MSEVADALADTLLESNGEHPGESGWWPILMSDDPCCFADPNVVAAWLRSDEGIAALAADDVIREGILRTAAHNHLSQLLTAIMQNPAVDGYTADGVNGLIRPEDLAVVCTEQHREAS